jgi:hypothetical protein
MKLIKFEHLSDFELSLFREKTYVSNNVVKINIIDNILNQIKLEKQDVCKHLFTDLKLTTCICDLNECPQHFLCDDELKQRWINAQTGWCMKCKLCGIRTNDLGIKLGFGIDQKFPNDEDMFRLFEMCEINNWCVK